MKTITLYDKKRGILLTILTKKLAVTLKQMLMWLCGYFLFV